MRQNPNAIDLTGQTILWKYHAILGSWQYVRHMLRENTEQWLEIFRKDEPDSDFKVADRRPRPKWKVR